MIVDISNEVFTSLKTALTGIRVETSYPSTTPTFPCVVFEELSNNTDPETIDTSGEKYNDLVFQIDIFSESETKNSEIKSIRDSIDNVMSDLYRMTRGYSGRTPNYLDEAIYRYTLRYNARVNSDKKIFRG